ncbi:MAG: WD40 repeat domain-containing protein, partial [Candidatus Dependentiae bacterium]|nr:WD40 repeat domain-containing protein [Candidatus Dependentiae bacterium]
MINHIKIMLIIGLSAGLLYGAEESSSSSNIYGKEQKPLITVILKDENIELSQEQWKLLRSMSGVIHNMLSEIPHDNTLPLPGVEKKPFEELLKVLEHRGNVNETIKKLTFEQQLDLWGCANYLDIPNLLLPLNQIIAQGLNEKITQFVKNPKNAIKLLISHGIDLASHDIGYEMIKPYLQKLWVPVVKKLTGHADPIESVAWSPDGTKIASGSGDYTVRIWDANNGNELRTLTGHTNEVFSVAWSPDGTKIASGSWDQTIRIWDVKTGRVLHTITGHGYYVYSIAWSPDSTKIASGSGDYTVRIWDANNGNELRTLTGHTNEVYSVGWSPDGTKIASGSLDRTVRIWDAKTGRELHKLIGHKNEVFSVAWSLDSTMIASSSWDAVRIWNANTGKELRTLTGHTNWIVSVAWSPDGAMIASGSKDHTVCIWDANAGKALYTLTGHTSAVTSVAWGLDGTRIASGSWDQDVRIWDIQPLLFAPRITLLDALILIAALNNSDWLKSQETQTLLASRPWYRTTGEKKEKIGTMNAHE